MRRILETVTILLIKLYNRVLLLNLQTKDVQNQLHEKAMEALETSDVDQTR